MFIIHFLSGFLLMVLIIGGSIAVVHGWHWVSLKLFPNSVELQIVALVIGVLGTIAGIIVAIGEK